MSPVPNDISDSDMFIIRKDSCESSLSMDSLNDDSSVEGGLRAPKFSKDSTDSFTDISDQCYLSAGSEDSDHAESSSVTSPDGDAAKEDSGVEADQGGADFVPPDDELAEKIIQQVEFYFSDANITKDAFLLKHVRRNKEGYVSLKLIASFKRVKHICKDWQVVAYALKKSSKLQINESGTKIRRTDPLPEYDETTPSRTVVAINLPTDKPTVESVAEMFRKWGEIALIRILRPGNPIPNDVRQFVSKYVELGSIVVAVVEFEASESARKAVEGMNCKDNWRSMQVFELTKTTKKAPKKTQPKKESESEKNVQKPTKQQSGNSERLSQDERKRQRGRKKKSRVDNLRHDSGSDPSDADSCRSMTNTPDIHSLSSSPVGSPRHIYRPPRSSPIPSPDNLYRPRNGTNESLSPHSPSSPWVPRSRLSTTPTSSLLSSSAPAPARRISECMGRANNVIRMPRGPDGSRGFHFVRQRSASAPFEVPVQVSVPTFLCVNC